MSDLVSQVRIDSYLSDHLRQLASDGWSLDGIDIDEMIERANQLEEGYDPVDEDDDSDDMGEFSLPAPRLKQRKNTVANGWTPDRIHGSDPFKGFEIVDAHATGNVEDDWTKHTSKAKKFPVILDRVRFKDVDGLPGFSSKVKKGDLVHPLGIDSPMWPLDYSKVRTIKFMYHHYRTAYGGLPGKDIALLMGRGWVGTKGYVWPAGDTHGTSGGVVNIMHPARNSGKTNGTRMYLSTAKTTRIKDPKKDKKFYGTVVGKGNNPMPLKQWNAIVVTVDREKGYKLEINGQLSERLKCDPIDNWEDCKSIAYRIRCMHGGTVKKFPAIRDYTEWFGGFYLGVK